MGHQIDIPPLTPEKFDPLGIFLTYPFVIATSGDAPYSSMEELAAYAKETSAKLSSDRKVKHELKAWKAYEKALAKEQKAKGSKKKLEDAAQAYAKVHKKYPDTKAGELANLAARRLSRLR